MRLLSKTTAISDILVVQPASADAAVKRPSLRTNLCHPRWFSACCLTRRDLRARPPRAATLQLGFRGSARLPVLARIPAIDQRKQHMLPWVQSMTVEAFLHLCVAARMGQDSAGADARHSELPPRRR